MNFEANLIGFHSCSYHSCTDVQNPTKEFVKIFNVISRLTMNVDIVIPYPDGLAGGGSSMETGPDRIPKGLMCNKDNRYDGSYSRLVGGVATDRSHHPWFTQLKITTGPTSAFACGGTIIDDEWIITSTKHCCLSSSFRIDAMIGGGNWIQGADPGRGEFSVRSKRIYTNVGGTDTCLISIPSLLRNTPYSCQDCYAKACLPSSDQKVEHGMYCWVVGNPHNEFAELGVNMFSERYF